MFKPSEIDYYITLAKKKKSLTDETMNYIYNKAVTTLEIELTKLGLNEIFHRIKDQYEEEKEKDLRSTMIKILYRCKKMEESLQKISIVFKLIKRRESLLEKIEAEDALCNKD